MEVCSLPPHVIEFIDDPKQRVLFRGVAAAAKQEEVRDAFAIVYEDLGPVRLAGDLVFNQLKRVALEATERSQELIEATEATDVDALDVDALNAARTVFDALDADASGGLDREELLKSVDLLALLGRREGESDEEAVDRFMGAADANSDGQVSFSELAQHSVSTPGFQMTDKALAAVLLARADTGEGEVGKRAAESKGRGSKRRSPAERFDEMLSTCLEWEEALLREEGDAADDAAVDRAEATADTLGNEGEENRLMRVLRGSFIGARSKPIADALRHCYVEYSPLRVGGDVIFQVLKRVMAARVGK